MEELISNFINGNNTEILIVGDIYNYRNRMSRNFINFLDYLKDNLTNFRIIYYGTGEKIFNKNKILPLTDVIKLYCESNNPLTWVCDIRGPMIVSNINDYRGIKIYDIEDVVGKMLYFISEIKNDDYDYIFYKNDCKSIYDLKKIFYYKTFIRYDHFIDNNVFRDYKLEKEYDILCFGCTEWDCYPFRKRLFDLLRDSKEFNVYYLEHPRYGYKKERIHNVIDDKLSKLINKSRMTIVTPSTLEFLLKKYSEVALSKSCMVGRLPKYNGEKYINCLIELDEKMTDEEIIEKIRYYLNNKDEMNDIVDSAYNVAINNYTYECGLNKFQKLLEDIKNDKVVNEININIFEKNQNVVLNNIDGEYEIINKQNTSTPGIKKLFPIMKGYEYNISIEGYKECDCNVSLWIGDSNSNTILVEDNVKLEYKKNNVINYVYINKNYDKIYVGLLFRGKNIKYDDKFYIKYLNLRKMDRLIGDDVMSKCIINKMNKLSNTMHYNEYLQVLSILYNNVDNDNSFIWNKYDKDNNAVMTVALPIYKNSKIVYLAMESLRRQKDIDFEWELIIMEEDGESYKMIEEYKDKLFKCVRIVYVSLKNRISLIEKWKSMAILSSLSSKVYMMQASDCYSPPRRMYIHGENFKNSGCYFSTQICGLFYNLLNGKKVIYDGNRTDGFNGKYKHNHLNMALRTIDMITLPLSDLKIGIDGYIRTHIKGYNSIDENNNKYIYTDLEVDNENWKYGIDTDGYNSISLSRRNFYNNPVGQFIKYENRNIVGYDKMEKYVDEDIVKFVESIRR